MFLFDLTVVTQRYVHKYGATPGFEGQHHGFGVLGAVRTLFGGVDDGRVNPKMEALVVEGRDGIADDLVG